MNITFIGHGYVGLVTACVFADFGNDVIVVGRNPDKVRRLQSGDPIIYEPGLQEMLQKNLTAKRIKFTLDYAEGTRDADVIFITVGTPSLDNGKADTSGIFNIAMKIAPHLKQGFTVVSCKSTVPVGTNKNIAKIINTYKPDGAEVAVASCPEFLREGSAISDTISPDRVVIGSTSSRALKLLIELHKPIAQNIITTDLTSAELIKYTANAILATKISFANLISFYCEQVGADVEKVLDAVGLDKRIGRVFLSPGVGYGGSCFPKDIKALIEIGKDYKVDPGLLIQVEAINKKARENFVNKVLKYVPQGGILAIWGLSFKPNTDDLREAPSLYIIDALMKKGYKIKVFDPIAMPNAKHILENTVEYSDDMYKAVEGADCLCLLTEWNQFRQVDLKKVGELLKRRLIVDGRNIYNITELKALGFEYVGVGR